MSRRKRWGTGGSVEVPREPRGVGEGRRREWRRSAACREAAGSEGRPARGSEGAGRPARGPEGAGRPARDPEGAGRSAQGPRPAGMPARVSRLAGRPTTGRRAYGEAKEELQGGITRNPNPRALIPC